MNLPSSLQNLWETKRKLVIVLAVLLIIIVVLGLVFLFLPKETIGGTTKTAVPTGPVTLTWWKPGLNGMQESNYKNVIESFQKKYPNVEIKFINKSYGDGYYQDIIDSMAMGVGPDIFTLHNNDLPAWKDYLTPISLFNGKDETGAGRLGKYKSNFVDLVVQDTIIQDEVYGVATAVDNLQMYVNRDILNQAQIALPAQNWNDLDIQIPKLTKVNKSGLSFDQSAISFGTGKISGKSPNVDRYQDILPMLIFQFGGDLYDPITKKSVFGELTSTKFNPALEAIEFYYSFADQNSVRYTWNGNSPNNVEAFTSGKLAYMVNYSYFQNEIARRNPRLNYEVIPLPQISPDTKSTYGFFFADVINRSLRDKKANASKLYWAEQFLLYLSDTKSQKYMATSTGFPAARRDVINEQLKGDLAQQVFAQGALYAKNYYKPDILKTEAIWSQMMFDIHYQSNIDTKKALDNAVKDYQKLILDGPRRR